MLQVIYHTTVEFKHVLFLNLSIQVNKNTHYMNNRWECDFDGSQLLHSLRGKRDIVVVGIK